MKLSNKQYSFFKKTLISKSDGIVKDLLYYTIEKNINNGKKNCWLYVDVSVNLTNKELKEHLLLDTSRVLRYILGDSDINQVNFRVVNADIH